MPVSFDKIPSTIRLPLYWVEIDPSRAGIPRVRLPALIIGQKFASGTAAVNIPVPISNKAAAKAAFGEGSQVERMVSAFIDNNAWQELWVAPLAEPSGAAATGSITVSSPPTEAGTITLYVAGQAIEIAVAATDGVNAVASAIAAEINATASLPVTAIAVSSSVNLTCRWVGVTGNDIDIRDSYRGTLGAEVLPGGLALTYVGGSGDQPNKLTGGSGTPSLATVISNMGDELFEFVTTPFTDSTTLGALETEYGFGDNGRWGWARQLFGHIFSARRGSYADLLLWGASRNSPLTSVLVVDQASPTPVWEWASAYCAMCARSITNDPARPMQALELTSILPAPKHQRFLTSELNDFAGAGLATQRTDPNGLPMILRETTTYQLNLYGQSDDAYTDVTTLATLARLLRNQRQAITSKFPRMKLADDGTRFGPGQKIVTPKIIKAELVSEYRQDEFVGLVENASAFKKALIVERDPDNPNRVNVLYGPDLVNQLRVFATLAQFRLEYDRGIDLTIAA